MEQQGDDTVSELLRPLSAVPSADNSTPHTESQVQRHIVEYVGKGIDDDDEEEDDDDGDDKEEDDDGDDDEEDEEEDENGNSGGARKKQKLNDVLICVIYAFLFNLIKLQVLIDHHSLLIDLAYLVHRALDPQTYALHALPDALRSAAPSFTLLPSQLV